MTNFYTFQPDFFNNNGDQGNILVLRRQLEASGQHFDQTELIEGSDFVLIGDASRASMRNFRSELEALRPSVLRRFSEELPTLIVGSAYEFFVDVIGLKFGRVSRRSEFVEQEGVFGYVNTDTDLPPFFSRGAFMATNLFGPLLAKNPRLLRIQVEALGADFIQDETEQYWIDQLRKRSIGG